MTFDNSKPYSIHFSDCRYFLDLAWSGNGFAIVRRIVRIKFITLVMIYSPWPNDKRPTGSYMHNI